MTNHTTNSLLFPLLLFFLFFPRFHRVYYLFLFFFLSFSFFLSLISFVSFLVLRSTTCAVYARRFFSSSMNFLYSSIGLLCVYIVSFLRVLGRINVRTFVHKRVRYIRGSSTNNETKDSSIYKSCRVFPGGL